MISRCQHSLVIDSRRMPVRNRTRAWLSGRQLEVLLIGKESGSVITELFKCRTGTRSTGKYLEVRSGKYRYNPGTKLSVYCLGEEQRPSVRKIQKYGPDEFTHLMCVQSLMSKADRDEMKVAGRLINAQEKQSAAPSVAFAFTDFHKMSGDKELSTAQRRLGRASGITDASSLLYAPEDEKYAVNLLRHGESLEEFIEQVEPEEDSDSESSVDSSSESSESTYMPAARGNKRKGRSPKSRHVKFELPDGRVRKTTDDPKDSLLSKTLKTKKGMKSLTPTRSTTRRSVRSEHQHKHPKPKPNPNPTSSLWRWLGLS